MKKLLAAFAIIFLFAECAFAGAWVKKEGEHYISPAYYYYQSKDYYDKNGNKQPIGCTFKKSELNVYGEYGLKPKDTLTFQTAFDSLSCGPDSNSGLADVEVGVIHNLRTGEDDSFSLQAIAIAPTGYSIRDNPRLGYGRAGAQVNALYGKGLKNGFVDTLVGFRHYFGYPSDQVRLSALMGYDIAPRVQFLPFAEAEIGLGTGSTKALGQNKTLEPDYKLAQAGVSLKLQLGAGFSAAVGVAAPFWGRNTGGGYQYNAGIWYTFN